MSITDGLRKGDIVTHSRTMEVAFAEGGYVELRDMVAPSIRIGLYDSHQGSDKIEVVKKARAKTGDVVDANTLRGTNWKRGTLVQVTYNGSTGATYMLTADGLWISTSGARVSFKDFRGYFKLLHVA